jgi:hypothetical protein
LSSSPSIAQIINRRRIRAGTCNTHKKIVNIYTVLVGKPEGKIHIGIRRRKWEDTIKTDLKVMDNGVGSILLAQDRDHWLILIHTVINLRFS